MSPNRLAASFAGKINEKKTPLVRAGFFLATQTEAIAPRVFDLTHAHIVLNIERPSIKRAANGDQMRE